MTDSAKIAAALRPLGDTGRIGLFLLRMLGSLRPTRSTLVNTLQQTYLVGARSLVIIMICGFFVGMVLALQSYTGFARFSDGDRVVVFVRAQAGRRQLVGGAQGRLRVEEAAEEPQASERDDEAEPQRSERAEGAPQLRAGPRRLEGVSEGTATTLRDRRMSLADLRERVRARAQSGPREDRSRR